MTKKELEIISECPTFPVRYGKDRLGGHAERIEREQFRAMFREPYAFRKDPCDRCERHVPVSGGICKECRAKGEEK